jgi:hypothetical protein
MRRPKMSIRRLSVQMANSAPPLDAADWSAVAASPPTISLGRSWKKELTFSLSPNSLATSPNCSLASISCAVRTESARRLASWRDSSSKPR